MVKAEEVKAFEKPTVLVTQMGSQALRSESKITLGRERIRRDNFSRDWNRR